MRARVGKVEILSWNQSKEVLLMENLPHPFIDHHIIFTSFILCISRYNIPPKVYHTLTLNFVLNRPRYLNKNYYCVSSPLGEILNCIALINVFGLSLIPKDLMIRVIEIRNNTKLSRRRQFLFLADD